MERRAICRKPLCRGYERGWQVASISYAAIGIFESQGPRSGPWWSCKMNPFLTSDDRYRDLIYDDDDRSYPASPSHCSGGYRFGRTPGKRVRLRAGAALRRVNGYLKNMIEAIANAK